jgi:hypothetical protein
LTGKPIRSPWRDWLARVTRDSSASQLLPMAERRAGERRTHSVWSFTYGSFRPRRRIGRRDGDHERIYFDWHEPRVLYLVLAIILMCCADALFTLNLMAIGAEEVNALMGALIAEDVERFLAVKIGVTSISVIFLALAARRQFLFIIPVFRVLQLFCAGYFLLILWELWLFAVYVTGLPFHWRPWSDL